MVIIRKVGSHNPYMIFTPVSMAASNSANRFYGLSGGSNSTTEAFRATMVFRTLSFKRATFNVRGNSLDQDGFGSFRDDFNDVLNSVVTLTAGVTGFFDSGESPTIVIINSGSLCAIFIDGQAAAAGSITAVGGCIITEVTD